MSILITAPYYEKAQEILKQQFGEIIYKPWKLQGRAYNEKELIDLLAETKAEALITEHDEVTEALINAFPELRFIGVCRGTPSNVAVSTEQKRAFRSSTPPPEMRRLWRKCL